MKMNLTSRITRTAIIAAIYCVLTLVLAPLSFGPIQFRFSEILVLLAILDPIYIIGLTVGCFLSNIFGGFGLVDMIFGSLATLLSVTATYYTYNKINNKYNFILASLWPTIFNGVIIGWMLNVVAGLPLIPSMLSVAFGEFVVVTVIGVPVIKYALSKMKVLNYY